MVEGAQHTALKKNRDKAAIKHHRPGFLDRLKSITGSTIFIIGVIGFLTGRVSMMNTISPFGAAFLTAVALEGDIKNTSIAGTSIIAGILTRINGYDSIQSIFCIAIIFGASYVLKFNRKTPVIKGGIIVLSINFCISLISNLIRNSTFILYDTLVGMFNSTIMMVLVYIYNYCLPILSGRRKRTILSNEEITSILIMCAVVILGFADTYILGASLKVILSLFVIAVISYGKGPGLGAAAGTAIGLITCISSDQLPAVVGAYAFSGLLCGIFKDMGKAGSCIGLVIADVVIHFYMNSQGEILRAQELLISILLFAVFPSYIIKKAMPFVDRDARDSREQQSYVDKMKDLMRSRMMYIKDVFIGLSNALEEDENNERVKQSREINMIINSIADKVCAGCDVRNICWKRDLYRTYQSMFELIDVIQADGDVSMDTIPQDLNKKCIKAGQLIKTANYIFDIYRINYRWRQKAGEAKMVVGEQLQGISGILDKLFLEIGRDVLFKDDVEEEIAVALDREGIDFSDIAVLQDSTGRMEVNIYKKTCLGRRECIKDISPVVSKVLKKRMKREKSSCVIKADTNLCCFKLVESVKYQVSTGIAKAVKDEGGLSGDNYSFIELENGKYMMALSDGMGTGPAASMESNSAITLLEKYLEAGFDKSIALKAINSVMSLKSPDDNFTTMDLCLTDLYTGEAEFIKIGAASTFIKRADGSCETIRSTTLPIGILKNVDIESKLVKLTHGDLVILITDGVQEAGGGIDGEWIIQALEKIDSRNPQLVAEELMIKAKERNENKIVDDMTILVSKLWEVI